MFANSECITSHPLTQTTDIGGEDTASHFIKAHYCVIHSANDVYIERY